MKLLRTIFISLLGLALAAFAVVQMVDLGRRAAGAAPTDEVLETYAPNTGPLTRPTHAGEIESQPLAATLTPPFFLPTPAQQTTQEPQPAQGGPALSTPTGESSSVSPSPEGTAQQAAGEGVGEIGDPSAGLFLSEPVTEPTRARPTQDLPAIPTRIVIPAIKLDAPVALAGSQKIRLGQDTLYQWTAPNEFAAGWHTSSAYLGEAGNTVLNGHNNINGAVFGNLFRLKNGDAIDVYAGDRVYHFLVSQTLILEEANQPAAKRLENARWISHSDDVRLTLVTCWPNDGNTHRLYVIAVPAK